MNQSIKYSSLNKLLTENVLSTNEQIINICPRNNFKAQFIVQNKEGKQ